MRRVLHWKAATVVAAALATALSGLAGCGGGSDPAVAGTPAAPAAPGGLSYTSPVVAKVGVSIPTLTPTVAGTVTTYAVTPTLPAGLLLDTATGAISGTPSAAVGAALYAVTATNSAGSARFDLSLRVEPFPQSAYALSRLVSDGSIMAATTDVRLKSPRGIAAAANGPVWVTNNLEATATVYEGTGRSLPTVVNLPAGVRGAGAVTGIAASNSSAEFAVTVAGTIRPVQILFATESGTISGWAPNFGSSNAILAYDDGAGSAVYKGIAVARNGSREFLYAADFRNNRIDVLNGAFVRVTAAGGFLDPALPGGYAPFNIHTVLWGGRVALAVAYARQDTTASGAVSGSGSGLVNVFDPDGTLLRRLIPAGGMLNAPWGMAVAPAGFGTLGNALLVGNSGDGRIHGFDLNTGAYIHALSDGNGSAIVNEGLWGIAFGNGSNNQPLNTLYLSAAVNGGSGGLYARVDAGATAPDVVAPTGVALSLPSASDPVSGVTQVAAVATDNVAVVRMVFHARVGSNAIEIASDASAPYSVDWNTLAVPNGLVTLESMAFDAFGNFSSSPGITVMVSNLPGAEPAPALAMLQATIFGAQCTGCHNGTGPNLPNSLNLTTASATAAALINVNSLQSPLQKRIDPGRPDSSYVVQKLEGTAPFGVRMPFGGPYLDQPTVNQLRAWIEAGALP